MKLLFASDLHGSASAAEGVLRRLEREGAQRLILLGDLLYHGPRNDLPERYDPKAVVRLLSQAPVQPLCVRGNCDAEIDQMVLPFPIMADYMLLPLGGAACAFVTHGHLFNTECPPPHQPGDVLIHGHTHVYGVWPQADYTYLNPGSAALPKENQPRSYMVYQDGRFTIKALESGDKLLEWEMNA
ncbi:MAG TPA: phosphodiesterase [Candidatus Limiplasma stercoravium]|nr:phosphodiesterase [Candidatus Limiplasma stercoravium]